MPSDLTAATADAARLHQDRQAAVEYFRALHRASQAWQSDNTRRSRELLDSVPWEPRAWEWYYLRPRGKE